MASGRSVPPRGGAMRIKSRPACFGELGGMLFVLSLKKARRGNLAAIGREVARRRSKFRMIVCNCLRQIYLPILYLWRQVPDREKSILRHPPVVWYQSQVT